MGRYVPPEQEGTISGNQLHGKHALGARANKISQGILVVRFEMPFPIWCTTCPKPTIIGQGVRFNAEKKKIGHYFTSAIWNFRMKHTACGGWIEIRTDPKNTAYFVTEGARKRDLGEDKAVDGDIKILTDKEREDRRNNAFATLEGKVEDKQKLEHAKLRLEELQEVSEKQWEDPYERNKKLRNSFRVGRKQREKDTAIAGAIQDKMSLGIDLLPEHENDGRRARLIEFGALNESSSTDKTISKPLFKSTTADAKEKPKERKKHTSKKIRSEEVAKQKTAALAASIRDNTRAAMDPFLSGSRPSHAELTKSGPKTLTGVKRKREKTTEESETNNQGPGLVDYDDSD